MAITYTRNDIIYRALRLCNAYAIGQTPDADTLLNAVTALRMMSKTLLAEGIPLVLVQEAVVYMVSGQAAYKLGTSGDHASLYKSTAGAAVCAATTLGADEALGQTALTVVSVSNINDGDHIGILLSGGTMQWTTVSGTPTGTTVTVAAALTGAASSGASVFAYTTLLTRPLRVRNPRLVATTGKETPIEIMERDAYFSTYDKSTIGTPTHVYYDLQKDPGVLYVSPVPNSSALRINLTIGIDISEFDDSTDTPDLPQEWYSPLCWLLASEIGPEHGVPLDRQGYLDGRADKVKAICKAWDKERGSSSFELSAG